MAPGSAPSASGAAPQTRRLLRILFIFIASILVATALVGDRGLIESINARNDYDRLAGEIELLRSENTALRTEARRLREEPAVVEEIARRVLGLISPGEIVFLLNDDRRQAP